MASWGERRVVRSTLNHITSSQSHISMFKADPRIMHHYLNVRYGTAVREPLEVEIELMLSEWQE